MKTIETEKDIAEAVAALVAAEPRFAPLVEICGQPPLRRRASMFPALVDIIVSQQLSKAAAASIYRRMETELGPLSAACFAAHDDEAMRATGLSRGKVRTLRDLCRMLGEGGLDLDALHGFDDGEVAERLTKVSGIGPWTAEIFLLSCLGRPDVFPAGDLALQVAAQHAFALDARPDAKRLRELTQGWRPWRAVAARLLWAYYSVEISRMKTDVTP